MADKSKAIEKLAAMLDGSEEAALLKAKAMTQKAMNEKPTKANIDSYKAACVAFEDFKARTSPTGTPESFANPIEVVGYLAKNGWKVSESTVYNHKKEGRISPDPTGRYPLERVVAYAEANLERVDGSANPLENIQREKAENDLRIKAARARQEEVAADIAEGRVMDWEQGKLELAARAAILVADFRNFAHAAAPEIIDMVGGDATKTPQLIRFFMERTAEFFDRYADEKKFVSEVGRPT